MAKEKPLTPSSLAEAFGISKAAAHEALQALVKKGRAVQPGWKMQAGSSNGAMKCSCQITTRTYPYGDVSQNSLYPYGVGTYGLVRVVI